MKISNTFLRVALPTVAGLLLASCATLYTSRTRAFNIAGIQPEERTNGYIFKIEAAQKVGHVEAWVGPDNWLYISIPDTSINAAKLSDLAKCPIVSRVQFFRYSGSVQVTLHLNAKFNHVGVLNYPGDSNVYVVLYKWKE